MFKDVVEEHAEETSFLWLLRNKKIHSPKYSLQDLLALDERLNAHIDGLKVAKNEAWAVCQEILSVDDTNEAFTLAVVATQNKDGKHFESLVEQCSTSSDLAQSIIAALVWQPCVQVRDKIDWLLNNNGANCYRIGLLAAAKQGYSLDKELTVAFKSEDRSLLLSTVTAVAYAGNITFLPEVKKLIASEDEELEFNALKTTVLLGDISVVNALVPFLRKTKYIVDALSIVLRCVSVEQAHMLLEEMALEGIDFRYVIIGSGIIGDPFYIEGLIESMTEKSLARVAADAFSLITGLDIQTHGMEASLSDSLEGSGDTEHDEFLEDPDENLPWPKVSVINEWWKQHQQQFKQGQRYLLGQAITSDHLYSILQHGNLRWQFAAHAEWALRQPSKRLLDITAPAIEQQRRLSLLSPN